MKKRLLLFMASVLGIMGVASVSTTTANAASWHKGTPTAIRHQYNYKKGQYWEYYAFKKSTFRYQGMGMPYFDAYKLKYKTLKHHVYEITGKDKSRYSGGQRIIRGGGAEKLKVTIKSSHRISIHNYVTGTTYTYKR
jgi:hypothetical protein